MAKSKVRGGAKAHRAKVAARNQKVKSAQSAMQKLFNEAMQKGDSGPGFWPYRSGCIADNRKMM